MNIYKKILEGNVKYPNYLHPDVRDLLKNLITADLTKRLGTSAGAEDIKSHAWFAEVPWDRMLKKDLDVPFLPPVKADVGDDSQYDQYPEESEIYGDFGHDE